MASGILQGLEKIVCIKYWYEDNLDVVVKALKKRKIKVTVVNSRDAIDRSNFDYIFDYKQTIVDNHESIVADKHLGGFFFQNTKTKEKFDRIAEDKHSIKKIFRQEI